MQQKEIKKFLVSQYFSDGLRITFGVLLPPLICAQLGQLEIGITISLGAITVSIPDNPGPVAHKRNAMLICLACMIFTAGLTGLINSFPALLVVEIFMLCFLFSMFNIYGNRASAIGTAVLILMILTIDQIFTYKQLLAYVGFLTLGGVWYMALSQAVSQFRPYRIAQHSLGECVGKIGNYLKVKAEFYNTNQDVDENYKKIIEQQIIVHEQQDVVREILFKDKMIIRNTTNTGRLLVLIFSDTTDVFEQSMAAHYDYNTIRNLYGATGVLDKIYKVIHNIGLELESMGNDINANERPRPLFVFQPQLEELKLSIDQVENNLVLKKILINLRNIIARVQNIYSYFKQKQLNDVPISSETDLGRFVSHQNFDFEIFLENFTFKSSIFRHSLRVAIVCVIGYLISKIAGGIHSYWILMTILVILKPAFSLTKQRNYQRLIGTFAGGIAGALIVYFVKDETARFVFMLFFMIGAYSFQRVNYVVSVIFLTPFILIMFSFIGLGTLSVARERIIDTFIGSFIALIASYFIFPSWEYPQLKKHMRNLLIANHNYLRDVADGLTGKGFNITEYKLIRKELYLNSASMGSALQRMLSEPKNKQKHVSEVSNFIVLNHTLSSYIATLVTAIRRGENKQVNPAHIKIIRKSLYRLCEAISKLKATGQDFKEPDIIIPDSAIKIIEDNLDNQLISEQLQFVNKVAKDLLKIVEKIIEDEVPKTTEPITQLSQAE